MQAALLGGLTLAYPLLILLGLSQAEPRWLALVLAAVALVRGLSTRQPIWLWAAAGALVLAGLAATSNDALPLKLYPVLVNLAFLALFSASLIWPPSAVERLARLREPELPPAAVVYTRRVTLVWCGFFVLNGTIAAATALWASDAVWALYTGGIAYALMGLLFGGEWLVRQRVMRRTPDPSQ